MAASLEYGVQIRRDLVTSTKDDGYSHRPNRLTDEPPYMVMNRSGTSLFIQAAEGDDVVALSMFDLAGNSLPIRDLDISGENATVDLSNIAYGVYMIVMRIASHGEETVISRTLVR
jgi:hypothetical protein